MKNAALFLLLLAASACAPLSELPELDALPPEAVSTERVIVPDGTEVLMTPSAYTPNDGIIVGGTIKMANVVALRSFAGPMDLTDFGFGNCLADRDADGDCADRFEVEGSDAAISLTYASYWDVSGNPTTSYAVMADHLTEYNGEDAMVPANPLLQAYLVLYVQATTDATPGDTIQLNSLPAYAEAFSLVDGDGCAGEDGCIGGWVRGAQLEWHNTKPTISARAGDDCEADFAAVPMNDDVALCLSQTADSEGDLSFPGLTFRIASGDAGTPGWNTCANLGKPALWKFAEVDGTVLAAGDMFQFVADDGRPCALAPDHRLDRIKVADLFQEVEGGMSADTVLTLDTDDLGLQDGDTYLVSLIDGAWLDGDHPDEFDFSLVLTNGPIDGPTHVY